ncbi:MAG: IMP dehydrogenase [Candidatus Magasanikbacteria bacterium CG11_big_fil_rev_8_21_14_0_20_39_34]|uniref:IMP dehydrogenase n=1 Tax=Candidatus Magasanikbacteria bacterium CG11_big_fil_rev_8_21_14_0_20_39_34 TaxID=1974653 RepID=A0A2H0N4L9_9BACT|nr:MAG: IMP dehydrogenase [Candidatus Magasanikbacteria bacterium CG11_big_fil_rev_8_21_14_0_20_39_34]
MQDIPLALTFSDVLLVPKRTPLQSRSEADISGMWTKNIMLHTPFVSANMASVTEHKMAIAMAREGGIGVIHQFGTIEEQVQELKSVKKSTSYVIEEPVSVSSNISIGQAIDIMQKEGVTSLLVMSGDHLEGIFTSRDYLFEKDYKKSIVEVMTPRERLVTAEYGISLDTAKGILHKHRIEKLPLLEDGIVRGLVTTQDIQKLEYWPRASRDKKGRLLVGAALGVKDTHERAEALIRVGCDTLVLDVAHAHSDFVIQRVRELKSFFPSIDLMVGNIATKAAAHDLIEAGADGLKVGIGPSPVCTTRIISGAGVPQLTAIMNVASVAKDYGVPVIADGGMKFPGDIAKAIAAGASSIYSGRLFVGCDESPGMIILKNGKRYKKYYGSASYESNHSRQELKRGRHLKERLDVFVEGVSTLVDYSGSVEDIVKSLAKGLQSAMSYCGAKNMDEMHENAEFVQMTQSGYIESGSRGEKLSE